MTAEDEAYAPVRVHITGSDLGGSGQPSPPGPRAQVHCRPYTVVLTSTQPVRSILDLDARRRYALVQAGGSNVIISNSKSEAENTANQAAGQPNPIGMVLPYGNTTPTKIPGGEHWYAAAASFPAQVTVLVVMEADQ
jgi:hypothetical protein